METPVGVERGKKIISFEISQIPFFDLGFDILQNKDPSVN